MYKLFSLLPTPILCALALIVMLFTLRNLILSHRMKKRSRIPIQVLLLVTSPLAIFLIILRDYWANLNDIIGIISICWLVLFFAVAAICTVNGYKRKEFNEAELKQLKILKRYLIVVVPLLIFIVLLLVFLNK